MMMLIESAEPDSSSLDKSPDSESNVAFSPQFLTKKYRPGFRGGVLVCSTVIIRLLAVPDSLSHGS